MNDLRDPRGKRGRPRIPIGKHRRLVSARFAPPLLDRLIVAADRAGHSLSHEIERRCQHY
jgi:hypothetical protein